MQIAFVMIVFQSDWFLEPCLKSVLPYGKVVAAEGPVSYWQDKGFTTSTDKTNAILDAYLIPTVHGQWREKDDEVKAAIDLVPPDTDFIWFLDSDEIWDGRTLTAILDLLKTDKWDSLSFKPYSFYGGFDRYMTGFEENFEWHRIQRWGKGSEFKTHRPPTILAPDGCPWRGHRHMGHRETDRRGWRFFHYSYVFPEQIKAKTNYYHSKGGTIPSYFTKVYLPWVFGDERAKRLIEEDYNGVHDWSPQLRGACKTVRFNGEHPRVIQDCLPDLRARFAQELGAYR